ncbi:MAG TPA: chemotaxis protein CheW [Noviherbaspirillum sp.]|nr:chemotaxis protein CheW [Noviherbaspirillum sp.]
MKKITAAGRVPPEEVLAFMLGSEEYGIDMQRVQEIRGFSAFMQEASGLDLDGGVANLRGIKVPIVDMRKQFALGEAVYDDSTSVIILNIEGRVMSMVVDGISDVHRIDAGRITPAPRARGGLRRDHLIGLDTFGPHTVTLIAIDALLAAA